MSRIESRSHVWAFVAILGLWVFLGQGQEAAAYTSYRGLWEANENNGGRILQQNAQLLSVNLDQDLSDVLTSRENVNYNYRWVQEVGRDETVSPSASLVMNGDYFLANLAANSLRTVNSDAAQPDSDTVGIIWSSRWNKKFVPELRFNYDYSKRTIDTAEHKLDEGRQSVGGEMNWDLRLFQAIYSYRRDESKYTAYEMNQDIHLARVNAGRAWLDNRLRVSLGHEYNESRDEQIIPFNSSTTVNVPVSINVVTGIDPNPNDLDDSMLINPLSSPYIMPAVPKNSLRVQNLNALPVSRIILYTQANLGPNPVAGLGNTNWELYSNNDPSLDPMNVIWTPVSGIAVTYENDLINPRFVIVLPASSAHYLKVVVNNQSGNSVNFTGLQAEQIFHGTVGNSLASTSKNRSNKSNFSLDFKLNNMVAFYYSFLLAKDEADVVVRNENEGHNGGVRLQNSTGDLKSNLSYNLTRSRYLESPEMQTQTYLLNINKVFLPTLSVSLSGAHEESSQSGAALFDRNRYTFYADAKLYPDLNSQLEIMYWEQENYRANGASKLLDNLRTQFTLTSRFRPSLVVTLSDTYEVQNQDNIVTNDRNTIVLTGSWQLSEWFSVNGSMQKEANKLTDDVYSYVMAATIGFGAGLELQCNYSLQDAAFKTQSGMASLRWSYHQNYSWEVGCNYAEAEVAAVRNIYKVYSKLSVNFSTR
ncbi:MAG: hypothetical protein HGA96_03845 [Desulfobulbaceae bacterium]|nr:hypothetical protein [Desulfobulbaceae bacterium]